MSEMQCNPHVPRQQTMFGQWSLDQSPSGKAVSRISYEETKDLILNVHYAKRMPSISYAFGLFENGSMTGIVTYGSPASPFLCKGVCGPSYKDLVIELNRLVLINNKKNEASFLVGTSLKMLPKYKIVVSYADTKQGHIGYVYQATNWIFTGTTKPRTDMAGAEGSHSRHSDNNPLNRVDRSPKHRYLYFLGSKKEKREAKKCLRYIPQPYPKNKADE